MDYSILQFFHLDVLIIDRLPVFCERASHLVPPDDEVFPSDSNLEFASVFQLNQHFNNHQTGRLNLIVLENTSFNYIPYIDYFQSCNLDGWIKDNEIALFKPSNSLIPKKCDKSILDKHIIDKVKFADF